MTAFPSLALAAARSGQDTFTTSEVVLYVVLPLVLLALGLTLFLRGRAAHREAVRIRGGFGGPPGTTDMGAQLGLGQDAVQDPRPLVLAAQRQMLWGALLMGVGVVWLVIGLILQIV